MTSVTVEGEHPSILRRGDHCAVVAIGHLIYMRRACGFIGGPGEWRVEYLFIFSCLSSPSLNHPLTRTPPWNPRPSLKEKWRIWHVLQLIGKLTLCLLETYHTTPRWVLPFPPSTTTGCVRRKTTTGIPPTGNTDGQEKTTQAGAGREISAQGEQTGSRRVLVSHLVNEIPHRASLYFGKV